MFKYRYHYQKVYFRNPKSCGNFVLYQSGEILCDSDTVIDDHKQLCYEVSLIIDGKGTFYSNGVPQPLEEGDCYFSFNDEVHKIVSDSNNPLRYKFVGFDSYSDPDTAKLLHAFEVVRNETKRVCKCANIADLFNKIADETDAESLLNDKLIGLYINEMLIMLLRKYENVSSVPIRTCVQTKPMLVFRVTSYIDNNIADLKNLSGLSRIFNYNYQYLSTIFEKIMKCRLGDYYRKVRMQYAKSLLSDKTNTVTSVSDKLGYSSIHTFSKAFKNHFGENPKVYQSKCSENDNADFPHADNTLRSDKAPCADTPAKR